MGAVHGGGTFPASAYELHELAPQELSTVAMSPLQLCLVVPQRWHLSHLQLGRTSYPNP